MKGNFNDLESLFFPKPSEYFEREDGQAWRRGSDLAVLGSPTLGPFHSEMDEELTRCLRLRVASLLGSGCLAGVLCARPPGHGFPVLVVIEAAVGLSDPGCALASCQAGVCIFSPCAGIVTL